MVRSADTKILDNIVRSIQNEEQDPLTPLIEEYILKRDLPKYRKKRLKSVTIPLVDRPRPGGRLSPSNLCGCERQAAFKFLGVEGKFRTNPDQELIFEDGKWRHHKWQTMFKDMEKVLGRHRFRVVGVEHPVIIEGLYIAGSLDIEVKIKVKGKWVRYVIDFKGSNNFSFEKAYRDRAPDPTYKKQVITYGKGRKCKRAILLYDSKDKNKFYAFVVPVTAKAWAEVRLWCRRVVEQLEAQELPPMHPDCNNGNFLYGRCPYKALCYGSKSPKQIRREVYMDFPGVKKLWEKGHAEIEAHGSYEGE